MGFLGTSASDLSDVTLLLLLGATALLSWTWWAARRQRGRAHHWGAITGVVLAWGAFLATMLRSTLRMAGDEGPRFTGPEELKAVGYLLPLLVHILSAVVVLLWGLVQIWSGFRNGRRLPAGGWGMARENRARHKRTGVPFLLLWYVTAATGVWVYLALYVLWS